MIKTIESIVEYIGLPNIIFFLGSTFIAFYFYFRSFKRLVYSTERICKECNNINDWNNNKSNFVTRILFYNNGKKTISRNDIKKFKLKSSNTIDLVKTLKGDKTIKIRTNKKQKNIVNINFEYLDSSSYFVLEINHSGKLEVEGRVSETGGFLHTEPKYWMVLNIVFVIFFFVMMFYNLTNISDIEGLFSVKFITNLLILFGLFSVIRYIHSILFIPDSLTSKYLTTKDKFAKEFKNLK